MRVNYGFDFINRTVKDEYKSLSIIYDDICETDNKNILAIKDKNKVGLITVRGTVILPCIFDEYRLAVSGNIIVAYTNDEYNVYRISISRDKSQFKCVNIMCIVTENNRGVTNTVLITKRHGKQTSRIIEDSLSVVATTKNLIGYRKGFDTSIKLINKNGILVNNKGYLNIIEVVDRNEILGVNFAVPVQGKNERWSITKSIDILDENGRIKSENINWGQKEKDIYKIDISTLYSRGISSINTKKLAKSPRLFYA